MDCVEEMNQDLSRPLASVLSIQIKSCGFNKRNREKFEIEIRCKCGQRIIELKAKVVIDNLNCLLTILSCPCGKEYHIQTDGEHIHIYEHK